MLLLPLSLAAAACLFLAGLRRVPAGNVATVHRHGHYRRTLGPGWHWLMPGLEHLGHRVCLIGHHLDLPTEQGQAELYYQILNPDQAGEALDRVDDLVATQAQEALAQLKPSQAELLKDLLKSELNRRIGQLGLRVVRCSMHSA